MSLHRSMPSDKVGGGGGGVGNPDPEKREAPGHKKIFFRPEFVPQFGLKKGGGELSCPPLDPPLLIEGMFSTLTERNTVLKCKTLIHIFNTCCLRIFCFA